MQTKTSMYSVGIGRVRGVVAEVCVCGVCVGCVCGVCVGGVWLER